LDYENSGGVRYNNYLRDIEWYTTLKQQLTPSDTALVLIKYEDYHSGDNFQYYNPADARPYFRFDEEQQPIVVGGWHHEWSPGVHTLVFGGRLITDQHFSDVAAPQLLLLQNGAGSIINVVSEPFDIQYRNHMEIYTGELNQLFQWNRASLSLGGRYQSGRIDAQAQMPPPVVGPLFNGTPALTSVNENLERFTGYGYLTLEPLDRVWLTGGLAYDDLTYPANFRQPPLSAGQGHLSEFGPKAAVVWSPLPEATLRGDFTRSLGGVSLDESYRLEPTQLAGFPQAFRSILSESVVGSVAAPKYQTYGVALDLKFPTRTYAGLQLQRLESDAQRQLGVFTLVNGTPPFAPDSTPEQLDYHEDSFTASLNQLLGDYFVVGTAYRFTQAHLHDVLLAVPPSALAAANQTLDAELHQVSAYVLFNHPSGFFARAETQWYHQNNFGYSPALPGDHFFQENTFAGYRFAHRHVEILFGILNLSDQDYRLNPLTVYAELPRRRTFEARLNFVF